MITFNKPIINLETLLEQLSQSQRLTTFAMLNLGIVQAIESKTTTPEEMITHFYSADNCLYVRRSLKNKAADEIMSRGVQLPDVFDVLPASKAQAACSKQLEKIRSLSLGLLRRFGPKSKS
jgi:hypothetical protein